VSGDVQHSTREELVQQNRSISKKQRINKTLVHKDATMADSDVANLQLSNSVRDMLQHKWYVRDETGLHAVVGLKRELLFVEFVCLKIAGYSKLEINCNSKVTKLVFNVSSKIPPPPSTMFYGVSTLRFSKVKCPVHLY
jgi:hypothetical protein